MSARPVIFHGSHDANRSPVHSTTDPAPGRSVRTGMSRRARLLAIVGGVLAVLLLAMLIALYLALRPERVTRALRTAARGAGLELSLGSPAEPSLFPRPGVVLHGLVLTPAGAQTPVLIAARGRVVLPWRALFGGPPTITRLQLDAPRVDLDGLRQLFGGLGGGEPGSAPVLPRIDAGITINAGSLVRGNDLLLERIQVSAGQLAPDQPFNLHLAAQTVGGAPYTLDVGFTPTVHPDRIDLRKLRVRAQGVKDFSLQLAGSAQWHGGADVDLALMGTLQRRQDKRYRVSIGLRPAGSEAPLTAALKIDGDHTHADVRIPPLALASWWRRLAGGDGTEPLLPPPLQGTIDSDSLDVGGVAIQGLQIQAGPAAAASTAPAAGGTSTGKP